MKDESYAYVGLCGIRTKWVMLFKQSEKNKYKYKIIGIYDNTRKILHTDFIHSSYIHDKNNLKGVTFISEKQFFKKYFHLFL